MFRRKKKIDTPASLTAIEVINTVEVLFASSKKTPAGCDVVGAEKSILAR